MNLKSFGQSFLAFFMAAAAHLDVVAGVLAVVVLLFQVKVMYYRGRREELAFNKEKDGGAVVAVKQESGFKWPWSKG